ncbi:MAG: tetratricopeptide repeat protein [Nitrospiraceae bacterium]|nr:tetratricopeptide repeat protein [Nitrospiraceae bacterium]MDW7655064.1 tetratricopeptide repeat protein [Nitrospiraceae bacterium]
MSLRRVLCALISLALGACAAPSHAPDGKLTPASVAKIAPAVHRPDASASYHFMLGYQAELVQDTDRAIQEYQASLKTDPTSHSVNARLASLYFSLGDAAQAIRHANDATEKSVQDGPLLTQMAGIFASVGQGERAVQLLDRAIELNQTSGDPYFSKGLLLLNLKQPSAAEQAIRAGLAVAPESAVGHYHLGRLLLDAGNGAEAAVSLERAIAANATFEPAYLSLASIYESLQDSGRAIAVLRKYLQTVNPRNRDIRNQVVRLHVATKDYQGARKELGELLAGDPADLDAQLRLALLYGEEKDYPKAIDQLIEILKVRPTELKIRDYLGFLYEESKDTKKALETYTFNVQLEPSYFEGHLHLGVLLYRLKQLPEATNHLIKAITINPKQPEAHIILGLTYWQKDQFDDAARVLEEGIGQNPKSVDLHFNLGTVYDKLNRFDDVVRAMEAVIKLDPHHADALNYLGYSYAERGVKIEQALSLTKQAVALKPTNGYYVDSLAWALFKAGLLPEALTEMKRALALVGDDAVLYEHLGEIYAKQRNLSESREAWLRALELDPSNHKLMDRFRDLGLGDPTKEERIQQAKQRASGKVQSPSLNP